MEKHNWMWNPTFGMFVHFGIYSVLGGEYKGVRSNAYAEWIMHDLKISIDDYTEVAKTFNPTEFNADEWISAAKEASMEYFVITAKHHDGFCLFDSKVDDYNIVKATPFGRDIVKELSEACKKYGMKFGIYYSQDLDWHEFDGGGYTCNLGWNAELKNVWNNAVDFPGWEDKDLDRYIEKKVLPQLRELLTNYGDISMIWFDMPVTMLPENSKKIFDFVRSIQPDCMINSRLSNGYCDFISLDDNGTPEKGIKDGKYVVYGQSGKDWILDDTKPWECAGTMNDSWGYCKWDENWRTVEDVEKKREFLNGLGINYTLNVGPMGNGKFPQKAIELLKNLSKD